MITIEVKPLGWDCFDKYIIDEHGHVKTIYGTKCATIEEILANSQEQVDEAIKQHENIKQLLLNHAQKEE